MPTNHLVISRSLRIIGELVSDRIGATGVRDAPVRPSLLAALERLVGGELRKRVGVGEARDVDALQVAGHGQGLEAGEPQVGAPLRLELGAALDRTSILDKP